MKANRGMFFLNTRWRTCDSLRQNFAYRNQETFSEINFFFHQQFAEAVERYNTYKSQQKRLRWSRGSVLAFGTQVRGFKPGPSRRIFRGEKILSTPSFGREVKPFVPCRRFTACKRSRNVTWKSGIFRQN